MLTTLKRMLLGSQRQTYGYLLLALLVFVTVTPFIPQSSRLGWIDDYLLVLVLVAAARNVSQSRRNLWIGAALGLPAVAARLTRAHIEDMPTWGSVLVAASTIAFLGFIFALIMRDVLRGRRHVGEKVTGAIVAYLLIGLMWSFAFGLVELARPGSFDIPAEMIATVESDPGQRPASVFVYYSYITLTTLGYGDITPVGHAARTLSWLEAVIGQLFVAVTIARLVGIHASMMVDSPAGSSDGPGE